MERTQDNSGFDDEISLVDLATVFIRRIWLFVGFFILFSIGGVVFALIQEDRFDYVSLYQIAEVEQDQPIEKPAKAIAVLESQKIPEIKAVYKAEHDVRLSFDVSLEHPENTTLVRLSTEATSENAEEVKTIHAKLLNYLSTRHEQMLNVTRSGIETRIESIKRTVDTLTGTPDAGQAVAEVMQKQVELESKLAALGASEVLVTARESVERVAPKRKLIVAVSIMLGFMFAVMAIFIAEFCSTVREALHKQKQS